MKKGLLFIKRYKTGFLACAIAFAAVCCKAPASLVPTQADATIAQAHWQGTTMEDLNKGYELYSTKCTQCHGMKDPGSYRQDEWENDYMPDMGKRARLSTDEYNLVLHYVLAKREELLSAKGKK
jgi:cytochrome c5